MTQTPKKDFGIGICIAGIIVFMILSLSVVVATVSIPSAMATKPVHIGNPNDFSTGPPIPSCSADFHQGPPDDPLKGCKDTPG